MAKKLANSDVKGAVRIFSSNDTLLPADLDTLAQLRSKHPAPHTLVPTPPEQEEVASALQLTKSQVAKAIQSFPGDSAGASCDLLLPQNLKDMVSKQSAEPCARLLSSITILCNKMLRGEIIQVLPFLYGAGQFDCFFEA